MAELDLTNIAGSSISTPAAGVMAVYTELTSPAKRLSSKDESGTVINYSGVTTADALTNKTLTLSAGTTSIAPIVFASGTNLTSAAAGAEEYDGSSFYNTVNTTNGRRANDAWNLFRLSANGSTISTIADVFGSNDGIPLIASGIYEIEWHCYLTQSSTGGTYTFTIVNTQAPVNMVAEYTGSNAAGIGTVGAPQTAAVIASSSASQALPVTGSQTLSTSAYFIIHALIEGSVTPGNVRLRLTVGSGTATPLRDSYFKVRQLATVNVGTFVA